MTWTPYSAQPIRNRETVRFRPAAGHGRNGAPYTVDGRFTKEERAYLIPLDAVDEVRTGSSVCSERLREECMRRCHEGRKPRRGRGPSGRAGRPRWQRGPFWTHMTSSGGPAFPTTSGHARTRASTMPHGPAGTGPGSPESGSPCPGGPAAGTMHASEASGDGWRSRWETRRISLRGAMAPAGRHADCCSDRRGQERLGWLTPMEHAGRFTA